MLPYINHPFEVAGSNIGAAPDDLKIIFCVLLSYPLCAILKRLPDSKPDIKNGFLIFVSLFYLVGIFDLWSGLRTLIIGAVGAYTIAAKIQGPLMPWIGFIFMMGHLAITHLNRQLRGDLAVADISGPQMIMVMKLTAFCWNVHDGRFPDSELTTTQRERAIRQLPSYLDYAGYVFFFPSLFTGPPFDFNEYRRWLDCSMFDVEALDKKGVLKKKRRIPRSGRAALRRALFGFIWIGLFVKFGSWYTVDFTLGDGFMKYNIIRRIWYLYVLLFAARMKYYGIWFLADGACVLSGVGYNGLDENKRIKWDRVKNVDPWILETGQNSRAVLEAWNKNTNKWLRYYVYLRVTPKGKKPGFRSSMATFLTSAMWHGFYPGYYMTFVTASFVQSVAKYFRRYVRPFFLTPDGSRPTQYKVYYDIFGTIVTQAALAFMAAPFIILDFQKSLTVWSRVWFYNWIGIVIVFAFFKSPARSLLSKKLQARTGQTQPQQKELSDLARQHPEPFGLPDHEVVSEDMDEIAAEIKSLRERRRMEGKARVHPTDGENPNVTTSAATNGISTGSEGLAARIRQATQDGGHRNVKF